MKVAAIVLTHQAASHGRLDLLRACVRSLAEADYLQVVDNGSTDGTVDLVESWGGYRHTGPLTTSGHGNNLAARVAYGTDADLCVFSDDDMFWRPGWRAKLEAWWSECPDDVAMTGCHLEPMFSWNRPEGVIECGGIKGLVRESTGGASWSMLRDRLDVFFGPSGIWQQHQGYGDVMACDRARDRGYRICQIDLAEHRGAGASTWGNRTEEKYGWDLGPVMDLLEA